MRKYAAELIGMFFLVFTIGSTGIASAPGVIPPLAIGAVLMVLIYAGGHISGAHYNPAITAGAWVRGALPVRDVAPYVAAQIAGSARLCAGRAGGPRPRTAARGVRPGLPPAPPARGTADRNGPRVPPAAALARTRP